MDRRLLKKAAMQSLALMIAVITLSYAMKYYHAVTIEASNTSGEDKVYTDNDASSENLIAVSDQSPADEAIPVSDQSAGGGEADAKSTATSSLKSFIAPSILEKLSDNFLMIKKPAGTGLSLGLADIYINQSIELTLTGMKDGNITSGMVLRVKGNDIFQGDPQYTENITKEVNEDGTTEEVVTKIYGNDLSHGITITSKQDPESSLYSADILITLDSVYVYTIYEDPDYFYIDLKKPSEVYDKIVVIDAGHGGKDSGAISKDKKYYEKNINLDILLQLKELLDKDGSIKAYYTRTADDKVFLRPRAALANAVDADYFISIHCNSNQVSSPNGTEVLYYDTEFKGVKAFDLADLFSGELEKTVSLKQKGIVKRNYEDLFIMDQSKVPTILIEVGYLSNKKDLNYLSKTESQKAVAQGIYNAIMKAYNELPVTKAEN